MEKPSKLDLLGDHLGTVVFGGLPPPFPMSSWASQSWSIGRYWYFILWFAFLLICWLVSYLASFVLLFWGVLGKFKFVLSSSSLLRWLGRFLSFNPKARHFNHLRYQVLGVSPQATPEEIRRAYRAQARGVPAELSYSIIYQEMRSLAISNGEMLQEVFFNYRTCSWSFLINNRRCYFVFSCVKSTFFASDFRLHRQALLCHPDKSSFSQICVGWLGSGWLMPKVEVLSALLNFVVLYVFALFYCFQSARCLGPSWWRDSPEAHPLTRTSSSSSSKRHQGIPGNAANQKAFQRIAT